MVDTLGEVARGVHTSKRQSITVNEAAELWLQRGRTEDLEKGTGAVKLTQLTTPMLESSRDRLIADTEERKPLTRSCARGVLTALKSILAEAQRRGLVAYNAAQPVRSAARKREQKKLEIGIEMPGKDDIQELPATASGRFRPLLITATFTGMRASELRGLVWGAVDFTGKTITVKQRADEWGTIGMPKSAAGQREIPMSPVVVNTLKEWRLACLKTKLHLVFPNTAGNVQAHSNLAQWMCHPLRREGGLVDAARKPLFNFHALRHFVDLDRPFALQKAAPVAGFFRCNLYATKAVFPVNTLISFLFTPQIRITSICRSIARRHCCSGTVDARCVAAGNGPDLADRQLRRLISRNLSRRSLGIHYSKPWPRLVGRQRWRERSASPGRPCKRGRSRQQSA
jgi:integrase